MNNILTLIILISSIAHTIDVGDRPFVRASPKVVIYKTKKNYDKYVPVTLSDDQKTIVVYPAPQDVYYHGKLAYPTKLAKGFLLDNRGISLHSVFLDITYKEYSKMKAVDTKDLIKHIKAYNPFVTIYTCGNSESFTNEVQELNTMIKSGKLKECECLVNP